MTSITRDSVILDRGSHHDCTDGVCLFEAYNVIADERHTDEIPPGVSPVLHAYGIALNDALDDGRRQHLRRFLPDAAGVSPLAGTDDDDLDVARSFVALDWLVRTYAPAWLELVGLPEQAHALRQAGRITDRASAAAVGPAVLGAQDRVEGIVTRYEEDEPRWSDVGQAAWDAFSCAARFDHRDEDSSWDVGISASGIGRWVHHWATDAAARPVVEQLHMSAIGLFDAMVRPV